MKTVIYLITLFFTFYSTSFSQGVSDLPNSASVNQLQNYCAHELVQSTIDENTMDQLEAAYFQAMAMQSTTEKSGMVIYTLPVVVHIIHQNGSENITDERVQKGIEHINQAFANIGYYDPSIGVSTSLQFCLAKQDPDGNATSGINRVVSELSKVTVESEDLELKNLIRWDPYQYINIWLVQEICSSSIGCSIAGYAYMPDQHGSAIDGIVAEARWMGANEIFSTVLIHELGHYFGLRHTFLGGCVNGDCLMNGDRVCDTPPDQSTAPVPCNEAVNTCSTDVNTADPNNNFTTNEDDYFWNYMDYGDWDCYAGFTQGQSDRMDFFLNEVRFSLLGSSVCTDPCPNPILASFEASELNVEAGDQVFFTNSSQNATNYEWYIDGLSFSNTTNTSYTFLEEGTYEISLTASNTSPLCLANQYTLTLTVSCPVTGIISANSADIFSGEAVNFSAVTNNANSYSWYVNGDLGGNDQSLTYTFNEGGYYEVYLISANDFCTQRSNSVLVTVDAPCSPSNEALGISYYDSLNLFRSLDLTNDGGCIIVGKDVLLRKSANLIDLWSKHFNAIGTFELSYVKTLANDEGFLVSGFYQPDPNVYFPISPCILKVDLDGNILWDIFVPTVSLSFPGDITETDDGNFIAVGSRPIEIYDRDAYVIKFSPQGEILWHKGYIEPVFSTTHFSSITPSENGSFIITGTWGYLDLDPIFKYKLFACKMDAIGNLLWSKTYETEPLSPMSGVTQNRIHPIGDGTYIISEIFSPGDAGLYYVGFITIDTNGQLINSKAISVISNLSEIHMRPTIDGNIIVGPYSHSHFFKMDQNLNILWHRSYLGIIGSNLLDALELPGHSILLTGISYATPAPNFAGSLLHTDANGFIPSCQADINIPNELDVAFSAVDLELEVVNNPLTFTDYEYTLENITATQIRVCPPKEEITDLQLSFLSSKTCPGETVYEIEVCNNGTTVSNPATPITFYSENPTEAVSEVMDILSIGESIPPGECLSITLYSNPMVTGNLIYAIINDDASLNPVFSLTDFPVTNILECNYFNNIDFTENELLYDLPLDLGPDQLLCPFDTIILNAGSAVSHQWSTGAIGPLISVSEPGVYSVTNFGLCGEQNDTIEINAFSVVPLDLGPDIMTCENAIQVLDAGPGYSTYLWSDLSTEQTLTAFTDGLYWVTVNTCDTMQQDTISISTDPATIFDLGSDTILCPGDTIAFIIPGFDHYKWSPAEGVDCPDCGSVNIMPTASGTYTLVASTTMDCISVDTIHLTLLSSEDCGVSSLLDTEAHDTFSIAPNPNNGIFEVTVSLSDATPFELRVYNALGQVVSDKRFTSRYIKTGFDLSESPPGMYFVQLSNKDLNISKKIIVL